MDGNQHYSTLSGTIKVYINHEPRQDWSQLKVAFLHLNHTHRNQSVFLLLRSPFSVVLNNYSTVSIDLHQLKFVSYVLSEVLENSVT